MVSHRPAPQHRHPSEVPIQDVFAALADPVRLEIVRQLAADEDWSRACGSFDVPVGKAALSHHFAVLREAGLIEQRDQGPRRVNRLRRPEVDRTFPGLWTLVLRDEANEADEADEAGEPDEPGDPRYPGEPAG